MKIVASAIADSTYLQDFLVEKDVPVYYEKATTVNEIIRNHLPGCYVSGGLSENGVTIMDNGVGMDKEHLDNVKK